MQTTFVRFAAIVIAVGVFFGMSVDFLSSQGVRLSLTMPAVAQEEGAEDETAEEPTPAAAGAPTSLMDYWKLGGPAMWALLAVAVWATALLIELVMRIRLKVFCPPDVVRQLRDALSVADYQKAWRIGMENPCPLSRVFCGAVEKLPKGRDAVDEAAMEAASNENNTFATKNAYISLCAGIAPLLGLFGTISGMIGAFNAMAYGGAVGDPTKLAGDIGEALITTYAGLVIAIPCMVVFYVLANRLKNMLSAVQLAFVELIDQVNFNELPADLVVATREMKVMAVSGAVSKGETGRIGKKAPVAKTAGPSVKKATPTVKPAEAPAGEPAKDAEIVPCPSCNKDIKVGTKTCPHCSAEMDWE